VRRIYVSKLSKPVQDFLRERIDALEQLEVLILLRADPSEPWDVRAVAQALRIGDEDALAALEHLSSQDLLLAGGPDRRSYRFAPKSDELAVHAGAAVDAYRDSRFDVLTFVSRAAMDRIRTSQVRTFAQAFLLREPKKKDRG
jgi:hypothetical protein